MTSIQQSPCHRTRHPSSAGRLAGLEVALHLSEPGSRERQPACSARRHAHSLLLTSASVMNAFFIPQLGSHDLHDERNDDAVEPASGRTWQLPGLSSQYSGDGFSDMHFDVLAVSAERFAGWIEATRNTGPTLDPGSYAALARQSINTRHSPSVRPIPGYFS